MFRPACLLDGFYPFYFWSLLHKDVISFGGNWNTSQDIGAMSDNERILLSKFSRSKLSRYDLSPWVIHLLWGRLIFLFETEQPKNYYAHELSHQTKQIKANSSSGQPRIGRKYWATRSSVRSLTHSWARGEMNDVSKRPGFVPQYIHIYASKLNRLKRTFIFTRPLDLSSLRRNEKRIPGDDIWLITFFVLVWTRPCSSTLVSSFTSQHLSPTRLTLLVLPDLWKALEIVGCCGLAS